MYSQCFCHFSYSAQAGTNKKSKDPILMNTMEGLIFQLFRNMQACVVGVESGTFSICQNWLFFLTSSHFICRKAVEITFFKLVTVEIFDWFPTMTSRPSSSCNFCPFLLLRPFIKLTHVHGPYSSSIYNN